MRQPSPSTLPGGVSILRAAAMRAAEATMIAAGCASIDLMERAGAAAAVAFERFGLLRRVNILCGPGNNGGDGYVIARHLAAAGFAVTVVAAAPPRTPDAAAMAAGWDGPVLPFGVAQPAPGFIDALFGIGLDRGLDDAAVAELLRLGTAAKVRAAVDLPSGVDSDSGALLGCPLGFDITVTFAACKAAHGLEPARGRCGRIVVADIGLGPVASPLMTNAAPHAPQLAPEVHKFTRGAVLVIAGPAGAGGAARLAARAALRGGAGLVTVVAPVAAMAEHAARLDAVMLRPRGDLPALLADVRTRAVVIGPGLGADDAGLDQVLASDLAVVADADALNACAGNPERLARAAVLTPHEGEFRRLFGDLPGSRIDRALVAAARVGTVVVLKGPDTVIAAPDGRAVVNGHASAWLATAGSGDVLAGLIAAGLAQGQSAFEAACAGVWLHGDAGLRGGAGLIAEDLPELLPAVLRALP